MGEWYGNVLLCFSSGQDAPTTADWGPSQPASLALSSGQDAPTTADEAKAAELAPVSHQTQDHDHQNPKTAVGV